MLYDKCFLNKIEKTKKKGIFRFFRNNANRNNISTIKEYNDDFGEKLSDIKTYSQFLKENVENTWDTKCGCVFSIYPRNLELYIKYTWPKYNKVSNDSILKNFHLPNPSNQTLAEKSTLQNFIMRPSSESIMEFGISQNNNIILPLIDWIDSSEKKIIETLYEAIFKFNSYIKEYPQYKEYLSLNTDYNIGLQQTYLKVYQKKHILWEFMDKYFIESRFIEHPPLMFYIELIKLMHKENVIRDKLSVKSSTSIRVSEYEMKDDPFIESIKNCAVNVIGTEKDKIEYNLSLLFSLYYNRTGYSYLEKVIQEVLNEFLENSRQNDLNINGFINYISKSTKSAIEKSKKNNSSDINEIFKCLKIVRIISEHLIKNNSQKIFTIIYQVLLQVLDYCHK